MMRNYSKHFPSQQKMNTLRSWSVVFLAVLLQEVVSGMIMGDLADGWHYMVRGLSYRELQPTRSPRQVIGSR